MQRIFTQFASVSWNVPAAGERGQSQRVTVPVLTKACTGRSYTIIVVSELATITKAAADRLLSYIVNRRRAIPSPEPLRARIDLQEIANKPTDQQGVIDLVMTQAKPENVAVFVSYQGDVTVNAPGAWNMGSQSWNLRGYT